MKFNNLIKYGIIVLSGLTLTSCFSSSVPTSSKPDNKTSSTTGESKDNVNESIFNLISNFDINNTYGFDYSLTQREISTNIISNSKSIEVRLNNNQGIRTDKVKSLNKDITNGQYTETTSTYYYKDNKIGYYNDANSLNWKDSNLSDFVKVSINEFDFSTYYKSNSVKLGTYGKNIQLTLNVDDSESSSFLGAKETIKNLSFVIVCTKSYDTLISFTMSYNGEFTTFEYEFKPCLTKTNIEIPD